MKFKKVVKCLLPGLAVVGLATALPLTLTSCSNTSEMGVKKFDAKVQQESTNSKSLTRNNIAKVSTSAEVVYATQPNNNYNAIRMGTEIFKNISQSNLQKDFDKSITLLYDAYEYENESISSWKIKNSSTILRDEEIEVEADIEDIKVIGKDESDPTGLTWKVEVTYEVEYDYDYYSTKDRDDDDKYVKQIRKFTIKPDFASNQTIESLRTILSKDYSDNEGNNIEVDELREFYFGDNEIDDYDDIGVFDRLKLFRKNYQANDGSILGYKINLTDLAPHIQNGEVVENYDYTKDQNSEYSVAPLKNAWKSTEFFTPSFTKQFFFYADTNELISKLPKFNNQTVNLAIDENKIAKITSSVFVQDFNSLEDTIQNEDTPKTYQVSEENGNDSDGNETIVITKLENQINYLNQYFINNNNLISLSKEMFGTNGQIIINDESDLNIIKIRYEFGSDSKMEYKTIEYWIDSSLFNIEKGPKIN